MNSDVLSDNAINKEEKTRKKCADCTPARVRGKDKVRHMPAALSLS